MSEAVVDEEFKAAFNLGYKLGETTEGRKKAVDMVKGREHLELARMISAGVRQAMVDDLKKDIDDKLTKGHGHGMGH